MISCKEIQKLMLEYIEGTLSKKKEELVREHIISCVTCRAHLETLAVTASRVESMLQTSAKSTELPPMLWGNILAEVQKSKRKVAVSWWKAAVTTVAVIAILLTGTLAPVFGYEGNLLNVVSGSILENAASDLDNIIEDNLLGSLRKHEIFVQIADSAGLTDEDIWELRDKGYNNREIVQCCKISENSDWTFTEVISKRDAGFGIGRIANMAGISIFSVSPTIAKPINKLKEEIEKKTEFEINTEVVGFDSYDRLISPILNEPINLPENIVNEDGNSISQDELPDSYIALKIKFDGKKPEVQQIIKHRLHPPKHFSLVGKIASINNDGISIQRNDDESTFTVKLVPGETNIFGELTPGQTVKINGFKTKDGRYIAKFINSIQDGQRYLPPRKPFPAKNEEHIEPVFVETPDDNNQETETEPVTNPDKPETTDTDVSTPTEPETIDEENQTADEDSTTTKTYFKNREVKLLDINDNIVKTDKGEYSIESADIHMSIYGGEHPIGRDVLPFLISSKIMIGGENKNITKLIIPENTFIKEQYILRKFDPDRRAVVSNRKDRSKSFIINSNTIFLPNTEKLKPGSTIEIVYLPKLKDLALAIKLVSPPRRPITGSLNSIDTRGIIVNGQRHEIDPNITTFFKRDKSKLEQIRPDHIRPDTKVEVHLSEIDGKLIVLKLIILPGKHVGTNDTFQIKSSFFLEDRNKFVIEFSGGNRILIDGNTQIFVEFQPGRLNRISLEKLVKMELAGKMIRTTKGGRSILQITILSHQ
jgi:Putative zinc-finger